MFKYDLIAAACLALIAAPAFAQDSASASTPKAVDDRSVLETVVVTSQKRLEDARKVPLSVSVIGGEALKDNQIIDIGDLTRNIPNISFSGQSGSGPGLSNIEIRGVSSAAGSATVGVYLDDVSLTTRNLYSQGTAEPRFFDLARVEVLRGPQGTLYGAGSMGGTLRFISKQPDLKQFSGDVTAEVSSTDHGGTNWMTQGVLNVPLQQGVAAFRIGVQAGHDSGYIDQVDPKTLGVISKGINSSDWQVLKLSAKVNFGNDWSVTPAVFYQHTKTDDIDASYLAVGGDQQYNAGVPLPIFQTSKTVREPGDDKLTVPSLTVNGDLGFADFTGVLNKYQRTFNRTQDGTDVNSVTIAGDIINPTVAGVVQYLPSAVYLNNKINQTSVEMRLASKDWKPGNGLPLTWVAGVYSARTKTDVVDNEPVFGINKAFTSNGLNIDDLTQWTDGSGMYPGGFANDNSYYSARHYNTKQNSVFGELTWHLSTSLRFTAGLRYLRASETFDREGDLFFAGGPSTIHLDSKANKATPRFALSWDVTSDTSVYANVADGFRLGGANRPIPTNDDNTKDLAKLGLTQAPATFMPDSLRSYELGTKSRLFGGKATLDVAIYHIDWKDIQQDVTLPTDGYDFETNLGKATSDGIEFDLKARLLSSFTLSAGGSYSHAVFAEDVPFIASKGDQIQGVPKYSLHLGGEYRFAVASVDSTFRLNGQWTGSSHGSLISTDTDYRRPSYFTADTSLSLSFEKFDLNFFVKNLTNTRTVLQQPSVQFVTDAFYLRPRTIGATISSSF